MKKQFLGGKSSAPTAEGLKARATDGSGIEFGRSMSLSTPIVSVQDGPRMSLANFGGKKAAPFLKGKKRRAKIVAAKGALKKKDPDGDNDLSVLDAAARKALPATDFVFPGKRAYPIHDAAHARDALARSAGKPEHAAVMAAVKRRYPNMMLKG